ncbi:MAG: hypothetical protein KA974_09785 [Saprospiraceae bacterium]|nr:hypothetical protein [Saprospiraceae bacterium]
MKPQDLSISDKLKQLYELQIADSELDEIHVLKGELPMEVSDLEDEIAGLDTRIQKLESQVKEMEGDALKHSANIKDSDANIKKYEKQLETVKNNREYDALTKELEMQKLEIQLSEKKSKELKVLIVTKQETLDNAKKRLELKQKDLNTKKVELSKIIEKTEKDEERLTKKADKVRKNIEDRLLKAYTKIRTRYRNGLAVVPITRDSCGGCFNKIPHQLKLEIGIRKKIVACEHCGRVLIDDEIVREIAGDNAIVAVASKKAIALED